MKKIFLLFTILTFCSTSFALNSADFSVTRISAPYFVVDGNTPATLTSAYVGFEIKNTSSTITYSNLKFSVTSVVSSIPAMVYQIQSPANGICIVGTLAPGQTKVCYFYVSYPTSKTQFPTATFNTSLTDNTASAKNTSFNIFNRGSISANAGGIATQSFSSQDIIGGIVTDTVTYAVGNVQAGDEADFQIAVSAQFDPTKIILLSTKVFSSSIPQINVGTTDSLYFVTGNGANGATVRIIWTFKIASTNFTTYLLPCAGSTSGNGNYKYALNPALGQGTPIIVSNNANPLTITKTSNKTVYQVNETATFTVDICNPGAFGVTIDRIVDQLPTGFTFQAITAGSQVNAGNSTSIPSIGATGTIIFEGGVLSGANTSYYIPAGGCLSLSYTAVAPSSPASNLQTTVKDYVGATEVGSAQNTVSVVNGVVPIKWLSFHANIKDNKVLLAWNVQETEVVSYEIEKSLDGRLFKKLITQNSKGDGINSYFQEDFINGASNIFYRIKQIDLNGNASYSAIVKISTQTENKIEVIPNPIKTVTTITGVKKGSEVSIINAAGKLIQTIKVTANSFTLDLSNYVTGTYFLQTNYGQAKAIFKQ
jgi:uncharacterized repeat protein (TIGR01451 family)